jgi:hypothetical protein
MKMKLAIGVLLLIMPAGALLAAHITVKGPCTLARAIASANNDASRFCTPGRGPDSIGIPANSRIVLTQANNTKFGRPAGLPVIRSAMGINGNGSTIQRALTAPKFGIFAVTTAGRLTLNNLDISGADAAPAGGLYNFGTTYLNASTFRNNSRGVTNEGSLFVNSSNFIANNGGAIVSFSSSTADVTTVIRDSVISRNSAVGAALFLSETALITDSIIANNLSGIGHASSHSMVPGGILVNGNTVIKDATITGNVSETRGGGIGVTGHAILALIRSVVSGNHAPVAPEIFVAPGAIVLSDTNNVIGQQGMAGVAGFVPSPSDIAPVTPVEAVVDPVTGIPAPNSLVIDGVTDGTCTDPNAVDGNGDGGVACDIGAVEVPAPAL